MIELHPLANPAAYVDLERSGATVLECAARARTTTAPGSPLRSPSPAPLQSIVRAVDPHLDVVVEGTDTDWTATVVRTDAAAPGDEVALTRFSRGCRLPVRPRRSLPLFVQ